MDAYSQSWKKVNEMKIVNLIFLMMILCVPVFGQASVEELNDRGIDLAEQGRYEEGVAVFEEAIQIDPTYADSWFNKGNALYRQGKYDEAIAAYDKAIEIDPQDAYAWYNKGNALHAQGKCSEAI
ncbi:tetratricopeptide repeat protein, partial [Methanothrix sp.]|uniref:tetratricopeptide repeat protein n=1 Tax=Methanothrix sp. TaxID=90426 RepID=UPI003299A305